MRPFLSIIYDLTLFLLVVMHYRSPLVLFAVFFSPITFWPVSALFFSYYTLEALSIEIMPITLIFGGLIMMIVIQFSNMIMLAGYDLWTDYTASRRRIKLSRSDEGSEFIELLQKIAPKLVALK